jgi:hypothetical protein
MCGTNLRIAPVQVGLLDQKRVVVVLAARLAPLPCTSPEAAQPVVRRAAIVGGIGPDVPIRLGIVARPQAFKEPGVIGRCVVRHEVEDQPDASLVQRRNEPIEIIQVSKDGIDRAIVRNVIAEIAKWTLVDRCQPDRIDTEPFQVVYAREHSCEIAFAVAVGVLKGNRSDLIDRGSSPPLISRCVQRHLIPLKMEAQKRLITFLPGARSYA